jgi:signal transduction histidine kinase
LLRLEEWGINLKRNSLKNKIWIYFTFFSIFILTGLWLFQVIFLNTYYEYQKSKELTTIANKVSAAYSSNDFESTLDEIAYRNDVCIEVTSGEILKYSSMNLSKGCLSNQTESYSYEKTFIESGLTKKKYSVINKKFNNKTLVYAMKLENDVYIFINVSLEPLGSTTKILASQLIYVTIIVLLISFLVAYFVSKKISSPITKLKDAASQMSKGNYDVVFETDSDIEELDELANTLNQAREELSKTEELRREFLANVSHDLKTPLTMIKAYAEMVRDLTYNNKEKREDNLNTIIDETERLNVLVGDLLELSKIQSNVDTLKLETIDLNELIFNILGKFKYLEEKEGYKFIYKDNGTMLVEAEKHKLEQVIYNLVGNAVNYVGSDKEVIIDIKYINDAYKVCIIDHGKGIAKEEINFIWDKYYRVDKTHKRNNYGTGLGLSIVKSILLKHNYEYGVTSKKGKGSTFYFIIPKKNISRKS